MLILFGAVLLPLYLFGELAEDIVQRETFFFDDPILLFTHSLQTPTLDRLMLLMSRVGYQWGVVPVDIGLLLFLLLWKHKHDGLFFGLSVIGAAILNQVAKVLFGRVRPKLWRSIAPEANFSFPSGHAMGSMALAAAIVVLLWPTRWRYPALVLGTLFVLLVSFSRIYLGVHYPSDILAGWVASFAWVMGLCSLLYRQIGRPPRFLCRATHRCAGRPEMPGHAHRRIQKASSWLPDPAPASRAALSQVDYWRLAAQCSDTRNGRAPNRS